MSKCPSPTTSPRCAVANGVNKILEAVGKVLFAYFLFVLVRRRVIETAGDTMFLDGSADGPDVVRWERWSEPAHSLACGYLHLQDHGEKECLRGKALEVAVFNVTNAEDVVVGGAVPQVQELGTLYLRRLYEKFNVSTEHLDKEGVARFYLNSTVELDERCGPECRDLLESEIVVPNLLWASLAASGGEELLLATEVLKHLSLGKTPAELLDVVGATFGLSGQESADFVDFFIAPAEPSVRQHNINSFLDEARSSPGETSGECTFGNATMPAAKCADILDALVAMAPAVWEDRMAAWASAYNTGRAAPAFIRVTVAQALGYRGASFADPALPGVLASRSASYGLLSDSADAPESYREMQVARKFALEGVSYYTKMQGASFDCRFDADCQWRQGEPLDACQVSPTCSPSNFTGYTGGAGFPARVWGEPEGLGDAFIHPGVTARVLAHSGRGAVMRSKGEKTLQVQHDGDSYEVKHVHWVMDSLEQRTENCDGRAPGSAGYDCNSPVGTVSLAPANSGAPLYASAPFFDGASALDSRPSPLEASYHPATRVEIQRCSSNQWCEDWSRQKHATFTRVDPESGLPFEEWSTSQLSVRMGHGRTASWLHPSIQDVLVPVYWYREGSVLVPRELAQLSELQQAPQKLHFLANATFVGAAFDLLCGFFFFGLSVHVRRKLRRQAEEDEKEEEMDEEEGISSETTRAPSETTRAASEDRSLSEVQSRSGYRIQLPPSSHTPPLTPSIPPSDNGTP